MNFSSFEQCSVCLENCLSAASVGDCDENDIKWFTKLQFIIPELEWLEEYVICKSCMEQLENAWEFKKLVLNLETKRRLGLTKRELYYEENHEPGDSLVTTNYFFQGEKDYSCGVCNKTCTTQTQVRQHTLQTHIETNLQAVNEVNTHKVKESFTCYDCDISFSTKDNLMDHIGSNHGHVKVYQLYDTQPSNGALLENNIKCDHDAESCRENVCQNCSQCFESQIKLSEHIERCEFKDSAEFTEAIKDETEDSITTYQCITCNKSYAKERNLNLHKVWCEKRQKHSIGDSIVNYNCDICVIKFDSVKDFNTHNSVKHNPHNEIGKLPTAKKRRGRRPQRLFTCEICSQHFEYVKLVIEHCVSIHSMLKKSVKPYSCEKCEMRFASPANLDQHLQYHEKNRTHICTLCGKGFITKSDLTVHEYTHYNRRNYKCSLCGKAFNTNKNLRTHNLVVHTDRNLWKYACSICEKRFPLKTNYEQHLKRHTGDKKYVCHICRKPFVSKTELKRHIGLHSNIRAFRCSVCDREYKERRNYETHLARIHGIGDAKIPVREKKFVCHICPSQFYDRHKLSKHLCSHSGLKPFACCACEKKFTDKSYLKYHLKSVHNIKEPTKLYEDS